MENEEINLNTESNDIAGNRIDGPVGNTAAKPGRPGTGVGMPGGAPTNATPVSSEALASAETSVGKGAVDADTPPQENKEVNPADLEPTGDYGGNFSNSTQNSYRDEDRRENQDSDPNRGEFGTQGQGGTTHGGFGNQNRLADYEPRDSAEDRYYGGPGAPGPQDNAYRAYDGRDERPDNRTDYGFEPGTNPDTLKNAGGAHQNDNGSPLGTDRGYASDYGHTSLRGAATPGADAAAQGSAPTNPDRRNQTEDYLPTQTGTDNQGRHEEQHPGYSTNDAEMADQRGQRPASSQGSDDRGRNQPNDTPDFNTGNDRNGYVQPQAKNGDSAQGVGSRGGSYNDAYDDSNPNSKAGSPAKGEERSEDRSQNYGEAARQENRAGDENSDDHGAPQRNAGRDGEADE